jgi:hypothetical protein
LNFVAGSGGLGGGGGFVATVFDSPIRERNREHTPSNSLCLSDYVILDFFQRALAALVATFLRSLAVMVLRRRFPPILPPLRPISDMYSDMLNGVGRRGDSVDNSTKWWAN